MIGIMGAMEEEVAEILKYVDLKKTRNHQGFMFYEGTICNKDVVVVQGGIGKVNATIGTTLMILDYNIDCMINVGSAGGIRDFENVGDVVISSGVSHHDFDLRVFGRKKGEVPDLPVEFKPDKELLLKVKDILESQNINSHVGLIVSGDQFVSTKQQVDTILSDFPEAICSEMEAASVAHTCHRFNVKFIITRSLSDIFNKGENEVQFDEYLKKASVASAKMCYELIKVI